MSKPTLFFSHSSKDKDLIKSIKDKLTKYTGGVLDIFMSSDGQSIPFGTNWIHKIEDGLNNAKLMFVFVTENSISSGWIYFEAGFAYSKGIHVIPVGIGVDIGALKAPLNLLQGFNISSADSLNNFISVINKEFDYTFDEQFTTPDYSEIISLSTSGTAISTVFDEFVSSVRFKLRAMYMNRATIERQHDIGQYFENIEHYLKQNTIPYSLQNPYNGGNTKCITVKGIKILYNEDTAAERESANRRINTSNIQISISPYNFLDSFELYRSLNSLLTEDETFYLDIRLNNLYSYIVTEEDSAALVATKPEMFSFIKDYVGLYKYNQLRFCIINDIHSKLNRDYVLHIVYDPEKTHANDIMELVSQLYELKLIYKKTGEQDDI